MEFLTPNNLILIPFLYCIGFVLKGLNSINNNYIPLILIVVGCVLGALNNYTLDGILQGGICSAVAMGLYDAEHLIRKEARRWTKRR